MAEIRNFPKKHILEEDVNIHAMDVNIHKPFGLRSDYVQIAFNYVQIAFSLCKYYVKNYVILRAFFRFILDSFKKHGNHQDLVIFVKKSKG